jgi:hypothetical protein
MEKNVPDTGLSFSTLTELKHGQNVPAPISFHTCFRPLSEQNLRRAIDLRASAELKP